MPTARPTRLIALLLVGVLAATAAAQTSTSPKDRPPPLPKTPAEITDAHVRYSMDYALRYLKSMQTREGRIGTTGEVFNLKYPVGQTALALLAMLEAGVTFDDPRARAAFTYMAEAPTDHTYEIALQSMVLSKMPSDKLGRSERRAMEALLKRFVSSQATDGMWSYWLLDPRDVPPTERRGWGRITGATWRDNYESGDRSNTQFAILALWEMSKRGVEIPRPTLQKAADQFLNTQTADGGWSYVIDPEKYGHPETSATMDATGLASLYILRDLLGETGEGLFDGTRSPDCGTPGRLDNAIERAHNRVVRDLGVTNGLVELYGGDPFPRSGYYSYSIERVGVAAGLKQIGDHDWYREGAWYFLRAQQKNGSWTVGYNPIIETSFGLLFLAKGRAPFIINKLRWRGDWNCHTRDMPNFVRYAENTFEQPFRWQIVDVSGDVDEWMEAPVLYMSGHEVPRLFTDDERKHLHDFIVRGGTLLVDNCCKNKEFDEGFRHLIESLFPKNPLHELPADHPLYSSHFKLRADPSAPVLGLDIALDSDGTPAAAPAPASDTPATTDTSAAPATPAPGPSPEPEEPTSQPWLREPPRTSEPAAPAPVPTPPAPSTATSPTTGEDGAAKPRTRTAVIYCPWTIGCVWNQNLVTNHERVFQLGVNVFRYATAGQILKRPLDSKSNMTAIPKTTPQPTPTRRTGQTEEPIK